MDGSSWARCRPGFLLPVRVLSKLFRRLMLDKLAAAHAAGKLWFLGQHARLADADAFAAFPRLTADDAVVRLRQETFRRTAGRARLPEPTTKATATAPADHRPPCPSCGGRMIVVETFERGGGPRDPPRSAPGIRTGAA